MQSDCTFNPGPIILDPFCVVPAVLSHLAGISSPGKTIRVILKESYKKKKEQIL
jgi:hypothetical protein